MIYHEIYQMDAKLSGRRGGENAPAADGDEGVGRSACAAEGRASVNRLSDHEADEIARAFVTARRQARPLCDFPGRLPATLEDAYRVQDRAIALDGRRVVGWKVAMIRPDLRAGLGADRLCGPIFEGTVHDCRAGGRADVAVHADGFAALEAEFVAGFGRDLPLRPDGATATDILPALAFLAAGAEVASSPLPTLNAIGPLAVVCDQGNNAGAVIGPVLPACAGQPDAALTSEMLIDGVSVGRGSAASVPGGPIAALVFLTRALAARGRHLVAGDVVLTGMTTGIHAVTPGSRGRIAFLGGLGCDIAVTAIAPRLS